MCYGLKNYSMESLGIVTLGWKMIGSKEFLNRETVDKIFRILVTMMTENRNENVIT